MSIGYPVDRIVTTSALEPGSTWPRIIDELRNRSADRVMVVGHNPLLSELVGALVAGDDDAGFDLSKGGLAKLTLEADQAFLDWLLTGKLLRKLAP